MKDKIGTFYYVKKESKKNHDGSEKKPAKL